MKSINYFLIAILIFVVMSFRTLKKAIRSLVSGKVTPNFKWSEFDCKCGIPVPEHLKPNIALLARSLEVIRAEAGNKPVIITSGYRTEAYNKKVGGVVHSQHLFGRAADIKIKGMTSNEVYALILKLMKEGKIIKGGVGLYPTFVHYDIRGREAYWDKTIKDEQ
ncbi:hypothetical protein CAPN001_08520 [Capnocytophaga stomatis]|nr:hypothetical protein CAPN002_02270 [Capnocytophaga stomatis]GIJ96283.1 hypothetical protein CAPN001_08520 [Capnocytophaga stomatis]